MSVSLMNYSRILTTYCILIYSNCMGEIIFIIKVCDNLYNPYNLEAMMPFVSIPLREYQSAMQAGLPASARLWQAGKMHGKT